MRWSCIEAGEVGSYIVFSDTHKVAIMNDVIIQTAIEPMVKNLHKQPLFGTKINQWIVPVVSSRSTAMAFYAIALPNM